jgi:hypothetical protein
VLVKDGDKLAVNFDPVLVALLRESRYFLDQGLGIPEAATKVYEQNEMYQQFLAKLDMTVRSYNYITDTLLPVERPLVDARMQQMNARVEKVRIPATVLSTGLTGPCGSVGLDVLQLEELGSARVHRHHPRERQPGRKAAGAPAQERQGHPRRGRRVVCRTATGAQGRQAAPQPRD